MHVKRTTEEEVEVPRKNAKKKTIAVSWKIVNFKFEFITARRRHVAFENGIICALMHFPTTSIHTLFFSLCCCFGGFEVVLSFETLFHISHFVSSSQVAYYKQQIAFVEKQLAFAFNEERERRDCEAGISNWTSCAFTQLIDIQRQSDRPERHVYMTILLIKLKKYHALEHEQHKT